MIEASARDAGSAYLAVERHKSDDFAPYVFKTTDFGKTWSKLVAGLPANDYVHAVRVDPRRPGLLFAGTEQGVYVSFNDGLLWQSLQLNLPTAPVNDLVIKNADLVVATHGRSFWVLDDITPLEQYDDSIRQQEAHLFTPAAASHTLFRGSSFASSGNVGKNPPAGAVINYWLKVSLKKPDERKPQASAVAEGASVKSGANSSASSSEVKKDDTESSEAPKITLEILDSTGKVIRKYPKKEEPGNDGDDEEEVHRERDAGSLPADAGLNRFVWDLRYEGATKVPKAPLWGGDTDGPKALPGTYQVRLTVLGQSYTAPLEIKADPRLKISQQDLAQQFDLLVKIRDKVTETDDAIIQIRDLRGQIHTMNTRLKNDPRAQVIADAGKALDTKMTVVEEALIQTKAKSGQDVLNFPVRLNNDLVALGGVVGSADSAPTKQSYEVFDMLSKEVDEQLAKWHAILLTEVAAYNNLVKQQQVPALMLAQPEAGK
jgi:hypothetical protein